MTKNSVWLVPAAVGVAAVLALAGCAGLQGNTDKATQDWNDAPVAGRADTSPAHVVAMPDGFANLAYKCIPGTHSGFATLFHKDGAYGSLTHFTDPALCP
jgi:hypothetical protein